VVAILEVGQLIIPHNYISRALELSSACEFVVHM